MRIIGRKIGFINNKALTLAPYVFFPNTILSARYAELNSVMLTFSKASSRQLLFRKQEQLVFSFNRVSARISRNERTIIGRCSDAGSVDYSNPALYTADDAVSP